MIAECKCVQEKIFESGVNVVDLPEKKKYQLSHDGKSTSQDLKISPSIIATATNHVTSASYKSDRTL